MSNGACHAVSRSGVLWAIPALTCCFTCVSFPLSSIRHMPICPQLVIILVEMGGAVCCGFTWISSQLWRGQGFDNLSLGHSSHDSHCCARGLAANTPRAPGASCAGLLLRMQSAIMYVKDGERHERHIHNDYCSFAGSSGISVG